MTIFCGGIYTSSLFLHCFPSLLSHFSARVETDICKQNSTNIKPLGTELTHGKPCQYQNDKIYHQVSHVISKLLTAILTIVKTEHSPHFMVRHFIYYPSSYFKKVFFLHFYIHTQVFMSFTLCNEKGHVLLYIFYLLNIMLVKTS